MSRFRITAALALFTASTLVVPRATEAVDTGRPPAKQPAAVDLFDAMQQGDVAVKLILKDSKQGRVLIENKTKRPLNLRMPEAFAGVPVLAQFGGGGQGGGGGGGQGVGGGFGGGGGGGGQQGGGGGFFNVPPERARNIKVPCVCLDHGKDEPNARIEYELKPIESYVDRPAVVELMKAFGNGNLDQAAVQAAAWHLNNDLSWEEMAAKTNGRKRLLGGEEPYFNHQQLTQGFAMAQAAKASAAALPAKSETVSPGEAALSQN